MLTMDFKDIIIFIKELFILKKLKALKTQIFLSLLFSLAFNHHASLQPSQDYNNYRAAKYSFMGGFFQI